MLYRELRREDAQRCAEIDRCVFADEAPWPEKVFKVQFAHPHTFYLGAFASDSAEAELLVGYAGLAMLGPREDPEFEVHTIAVAPKYQGLGIGRHLMDNLVHVADHMGGPMHLEVRVDNEPAIALYRSYGFEVLATRKNYYQPSGADAYTMMRHPNPANPANPAKSSASQ